LKSSIAVRWSLTVTLCVACEAIREPPLYCIRPWRQPMDSCIVYAWWLVDCWSITPYIFLCRHERGHTPGIVLEWPSQVKHYFEALERVLKLQHLEVLKYLHLIYQLLKYLHLFNQQLTSSMKKLPSFWGLADGAVLCWIPIPPPPFRFLQCEPCEVASNILLTVNLIITFCK